MNKLWRKLKASMIIGAVWGVGWFAAGMAMLAAGARADVPFPVGFGVLGFLAGTAFSGVLMLAEGRSGGRRLSIGRFALWGALGGAALASVFGGIVYLVEGVVDPLLVTLIVFPVAGALSAAGTLGLTRWADSGTPVGAGEDLDAIGLSDREERELLGGDR